MILVPLGLAIYAIRKNVDVDKLQDFFRASVEFQTAEKRFSLVLSFLLMPILYLSAAIIKDPHNLAQIFCEKINMLTFMVGFLLFFLGAIIEELAWTTYALRYYRKPTVYGKQL